MDHHYTLGRLTSITTEHGQTLYDYDPITGQLDATTSDNGIVTAMSYDGALLLPTRWSAGGNTFGTVARTYNADWLVDTIRVNGNDAVVNQYDDDGRLVRADSAGVRLKVIYSAGTNQIGQTTLEKLATHQIIDARSAYNAYGEVSTYESGIAIPDDASHIEPGFYRYTIGARDARGRILQRQETLFGYTASALTTSYDYAYDAAGRLQQVLRDGAPYMSLTYDANRG